MHAFLEIPFLYRREHDSTYFPKIKLQVILFVGKLLLLRVRYGMRSHSGMAFRSLENPFSKNPRLLLCLKALMLVTQDDPFPRSGFISKGTHTATHTHTHRDGLTNGPTGPRPRGP